MDIQKIVERIHKRCETMENSLFQQQDSFIQQVLEEETSQLSPPMKERITSEFFGWGPLESIFQKTDIFEVMITARDQMWYEDSQGIHRIDESFCTTQTFRNFVHRLSQKSNIITSAQKPYGDGHFDQFRVHIVTPPITEEVSMTLRKHCEKVWSLENLLSRNSMTPEQMELIKKLLIEKSNFLIVGPTGSGKTTLLNSLLATLPQNERVLIIEDTSELKTPNPLSVKLLTRLSQSKELENITQESLVKQSLRMRPDRIITGEIRGAEAKDLLQALATGHSGSMATLHASSAQQALIRLEMLIQMGAPQWSLDAIRRLIQISLNYIVVLGNDKQSKSIKGIYRLGSLEKFGFLIEKIN